MRLDTIGKVWVYTPGSHKTEHHDRERKIYLGPRAQAVLRNWLKTDLSAYLFSPKEAMEERWAELRRNRKTPLTPSWHPHQLRHNAGTRLGKEFGLDTARIILGHSSPVTTAICAEIDHDKAFEVMEQVG